MHLCSQRNDFKFNYKIEAIDKCLFPHHSFSPDTGYYIAIWDTTSSIINQSGLINSFSLAQNFPNPFNPTTTIKFTVPQEDRRETKNVILKVYDVLGNEIETLVNEENPAGEYEIQFNAEELSSGIYFYQLRAGNFIDTKKMVLMK